MAHVIQLSVAPVFLLSGIGALLSVVSARVGRIVDRSRHLKENLLASSELPQPQRPEILLELAMLSRRVRWANWSISLCTTCALLICTLIVILFVGAFLSLDVSHWRFRLQHGLDGDDLYVLGADVVAQVDRAGSRLKHCDLSNSRESL